uniref:Uncharacterized protein n=1 Tax=Panagrolaimus sp. PS1159 TaxID=55785 RepID=A0AC35GL28_9BILA
MLLPFCKINAENGVFGIDTIHPITEKNFTCLAEEGNFTFFIGRIYRSLGEIDEDGIQNIINARKAGWNFVDAYIIPCLKDECPTAKEQIELALNATIAKGAQIGILWISIPSLTCKEILPWPLYQNCNESWTNWPWSSNLTFNQAFILEMIKQAEAMGFRVGIYSSHLRWPSVVGKEWNGISDKPLWFARFVKDKKKYVNVS